eukprot:gene367-670_t
MKRIKEAVLNRVKPWERAAVSQVRVSCQRGPPSTSARCGLNSLTIDIQRFMSALSSQLNWDDTGHILQRYTSTSINLSSIIKIQRCHFYSTFASGENKFDVTDDYVLKGIFTDKLVLKDFLSNVLIGDQKILTKDTKIEDITSYENEYVKTFPTSKINIPLFNLEIKTNNGNFIVQIHKGRKTSSAKYIEMVRGYSAVVYSHQEIKNSAGKVTGMRNISSLLPIFTISITNTDKYFLDVDAPCISYHLLTETTTREQIMNEFSYTFIELSKFIENDPSIDNNTKEWLSFLKSQNLSRRYNNEQINHAVQYVKDIQENHYDDYLKSRSSEPVIKPVNETVFEQGIE